MEVQELVAVDGKLSYKGTTQLALTDRPGSQNDVGVVAWVFSLKTPECPQGRQVGAARWPEAKKRKSRT